MGWTWSMFFCQTCFAGRASAADPRGVSCLMVERAPATKIVAGSAGSAASALYVDNFNSVGSARIRVRQ